MTKFLGGLQIVMLAFQGAPEVINLVPPRYHPLLHFACSAAQALGWYAQRGYDPQGVRTPGEKK